MPTPLWHLSADTNICRSGEEFCKDLEREVLVQSIEETLVSSNAVPKGDVQGLRRWQFYYSNTIISLPVC